MKKLTWSQKVAFAMSMGGGNIITTLIAIFLTAYYTDTALLGAASIGTMMLVLRIFDGGTDLLMGGIIEKTKTKWGKARPWLLFTAPFMLVAIVLLLNVPEKFGVSQKLVYAYITYAFLSCIVQTAYQIADNALLARVTLDPQERQEMCSIAQIISGIIGIVISSFTIGLVMKFGWGMVAFIYGVVTMLMLLWGFLGVKEQVGVSSGDAVAKKNDVPFRQAIPALFKNKYFYLLGLLFILLQIAVVNGNASTVYYCRIVLHNMRMMAVLSIAYNLPMVVVNFFLPSVVKKIGRRNSLIIASIVNIAGFYLCGAGGLNVTIVTIGCVLKGLGLGSFFACIYAFTGDVVDYGEWKHNIRSEGLVNSCISFGLKVGIGLGSAATAWILAIGGYVGSAKEQTASAVHSVRFAYGYFGAIMSVLLLAAVLFMDIEKHSGRIKADLETRYGKA